MRALLLLVLAAALLLSLRCRYGARCEALGTAPWASVCGGEDGATPLLCPALQASCHPLCRGLRAELAWLVGVDSGSELRLRFAASYRYGAQGFERATLASDVAPMDLVNAPTEALPPYPGGAPRWESGFAAYGSAGAAAVAAAPACLFVLAADRLNARFLWSVVPRRVLELGVCGSCSPACLNPTCQQGQQGGRNCSECGYAGCTLLEGRYYAAGVLCATSPALRPACLELAACARGVWSTADGAGPAIFAAVLDRRGVTLHVNPVWPGLDAAAAVVAPRPLRAQRTVRLPAGKATTFWSQLVDTGQPDFGGEAPAAVAPLIRALGK